MPWACQTRGQGQDEAEEGAGEEGEGDGVHVQVCMRSMRCVCARVVCGVCVKMHKSSVLVKVVYSLHNYTQFFCSFSGTIIVLLAVPYERPTPLPAKKSQ
jgi:hypothetical protein